MRAIELAAGSKTLRETLWESTAFFRNALTQAGFDVVEGEHPIVPVMLYDAHVASRFAARLLELGIYVVSFTYPVVPTGEARIRVQISAAHTRKDLQQTIDAFVQVRQELSLQEE